MAVWVCNNGSASPLRIPRRCQDCGRILAQGRECSINRWNSKADAGAKRGCAIGSKWIKLKHATGKLSSEVLRSAAVPML
jgi:hypothetical protein